MVMTADELKRQVFPGESGGDYGALFGYSNRPGRTFGNVDLTRMTVNQAIEFSNPRGPYGQWVKDQIGRVATPMGAYQIVGTTLRAAKEGLGLSGNEVMTPELQDRLGMWIYGQQGPGAWEAWGRGGSSQPRTSAQTSSQGAPMAGLMDTGRVSAQNTPSAGLMGMSPEPQGFRERLMRDVRSGDFADNLTLALNSLRMRPDQGLADMVMQRQEQRAQERQANRTAEWLASIGRTDLAEAVASGFIDARTAAVTAMTPQPEPLPVEGKVVGNNLVDPYTGRVIYEGPQDTEPNAAERDIALLQEIGLSREEAIRVTQLYATSRDPITGEVTLIDRSTALPVNINGQPAAPVAPTGGAVSTETPLPEGTDIYPNATKAFGGPGALRSLANTAAGMVGAPPPFRAVQQVIAQVNVLRESLLGGMAMAYQRQPNDHLMRRIYELTPAPGSFFESTSEAVSKLSALANEFNTELALARRALSSNLSPEMRLENEIIVRELESGLVQINQLRDALSAQGDTGGEQSIEDRLRAYE